MTGKTPQRSRASVIGTYAAGNVFRQFVGVANAVLKPRLLSPEMFGLWNLLSLILSYAPYFHFGARTAMMYLLPFHEGRGDALAAARARGAVYTGSLVLSLALALGIAVAALLFAAAAVVRAGLFAMAGAVVLTWFFEYHVSMLKAQQRFARLAFIHSLMAVVSCGLNVALLLMFGIYGLYAAIVSSLAVMCIVVARQAGKHARERFRMRVFQGLVAVGMPIMVLNLSTLLIRTADRFIIGHYLGLDQLGYYGIAGMTLGFLLKIPGAAREVIEIELMQSLSRQSRLRSLKQHFFSPLINAAYYVPFLIGPVVFCLPPAVRLLLPRYAPGIVPTQMIALFSYFLSTSFVLRGMVVANKLQVRALGIMILALAANVVLSVLLIHLGGGIREVAVASGLSFMLMFGGLLWVVRRDTRWARRHWSVHLRGLWLPFPVMTGLVVSLPAATHRLGMHPYAAAVLCTGFFCLVMAGLVQARAGKNKLLRPMRRNRTKRRP